MACSKEACLVDKKFKPLFAWSVDHLPAQRARDPDTYLVLAHTYNGAECRALKFKDFRPFLYLDLDAYEDDRGVLDNLEQSLRNRIRRTLFGKEHNMLRVPWEDYKRAKDDESEPWKVDASFMTEAELGDYEGPYGLSDARMLTLELVRKEQLIGYEPTSPTDATRKKKLWGKVTCLNQAVLDAVQRCFYRSLTVFYPYSGAHGGSVAGELKCHVYEARMKLQDRFMYQTHLVPCKWFTMREGTTRRVQRYKDKITNQKVEFEARAEGIVPSKDIEKDMMWVLHDHGIPNEKANPEYTELVLDTEYTGKSGFCKMKDLEDHLLALGHVWVKKRPGAEGGQVHKEIFVYADPNSKRFQQALTKMGRTNKIRSERRKALILRAMALEQRDHPEKKLCDPEIQKLLDKFGSESPDPDPYRDLEAETLLSQDRFEDLWQIMRKPPVAPEDQGELDPCETMLSYKTTELPEPSELKDCTVWLFDTVQKTYEGWMQRFKDLDPDIVKTYNGDKFDWAKIYTEHMLHAAENPGRQECLQLSRLKGEYCIVESKRFNSRAKGENQYMKTKMTGRLVFDLLEFVKTTYKNRKYSLQAMLSFFKLAPKDDIEITEINRSGKQGLALVAKMWEYCLMDCYRTLQLSDKINFNVQFLAIAAITVSPIIQLAEGGNSKKSMNLISYACRNKDQVLNYVPPKVKPSGQFKWEEKKDAQTKWFKCQITVERKPNTEADFMKWFPKGSVLWGGTWTKSEGLYKTLVKTRDERSKQEIEHRLIERGLVLVYSGAKVISPKRGLQDCCCPTLDFSSLYPSIIIAFNLCYQTLIKNKAYLTWPCMKGLFTTHNISEDRIHYFVHKDLYQGLVPDLLAGLISFRKVIQGLMEFASGLERVCLDAFQLILKITANALYGFQGFACGPLPQMESAETVTYNGRVGLEHTTKVAESTDIRTVVNPETWRGFVEDIDSKHGWPIRWYPDHFSAKGLDRFQPVVRPNGYDCPTSKVCKCPENLSCTCPRRQHCAEIKDGTEEDKMLIRMRKAIDSREPACWEVNPETGLFFQDRIDRAREQDPDFKFVWDTYGPLCAPEEVQKYMVPVPERIKNGLIPQELYSLVLYGDTDSIMPKGPVSTDRHGRRISVHFSDIMATRITKSMTLGLKIVFEKVYCPIFLDKKKRYAGIKWMSPDDLAPKIEIKGFQTQRRDFVPAYTAFMLECFNSILKTRNFEGALAKERELKEAIVGGKIGMENFEQSKSYKGHYASDTVIQEVCARQRVEDGESEAMAGDRIYYYIGDTGNPLDPTYKKVIEGSRAARHMKAGTVPKGFRAIIDHAYYLEHTLKNPYVALMSSYCGSKERAKDRFNAFVSQVVSLKSGFKPMNQIFASRAPVLPEESVDEAEIAKLRAERMARQALKKEQCSKRKRPAKARAKGPSEPQSVPASKPLPVRKKPCKGLNQTLDMFLKP